MEISLPDHDTAIFSEDRQYRYILQREVNAEGHGTTVSCMLNGSTADEKDNDPTIGRNIEFAVKQGTRWLIVVNMYGATATDPKQLGKMIDPIGPDNDKYIQYAIARATNLLVAWGDQSWLPGFRLRERDLLQLMQPYNPQYLDWKPGGVETNDYVGLTKKGHPRHPLYHHGTAITRPMGVTKL